MFHRNFIFFFYIINFLFADLQIGDDAPDFVLKDQEGFSHNLSSHKGSFVCLFFYARDYTFSAQKKMRAMEKLVANSTNDKFIIYGISSDSIDKHYTFYNKMQISFDLLADQDKKVITSYKANGFIETRPLVVLIGPDGRLFRIYSNMQKFLCSKDLINFIINNGN